MEPSLRGYYFKDAFDFYKKFLKILHEDFKYINKKKFDMKKVSSSSTELQEEWEIM